jgi:hypothetical protein
MRKELKVAEALRQRAVLALLLCLWSAAVSANAQGAFYVDPVNGSDAADGTATNTAFHTLNRARDAVRGVNPNMSADITVFLRGGVHVLTNTFSLSAQDSGSQGHDVVYRAYPDETPIISGGRRITGWTLFDADKNIYQAPVDAGLDFRQIYVDGARAIRARKPNQTNDITFSEYYRAISASNPSNAFVVSASSLGHWTNLNQVECVWLAHWQQKRARLAAITTNGVQTPLLINRDPAIARYDGGAVDDGNTTGGVSGIPAASFSSGFAFNLEFTPAADDLTGTVLLMEIGGTASGTGLFLVEGVPTFVSKQGSADDRIPEYTLPDLSLYDQSGGPNSSGVVAAQSGFGVLSAGQTCSIGLTWDHTGKRFQLDVQSGGQLTTNSFAVTGTPVNWAGNSSLTVGPFTVKSSIGGGAGANAGSDVGAPWDADLTKSLAGSIQRALYWNGVPANTVWNFNTDGDTEGWSVWNQISNPTVSGGALHLTVTSYPFFIHFGLNINGSKNPYVYLNQRNQTAANRGNIFWITSADPNWDEVKKVSFTITRNDSNFESYEINLSGNTNWVGQTITGLRVDPIAVGGVTNGLVDIDSIAVSYRLVTSNTPEATLTFMSPEANNWVLNHFANDNNLGYYTWYYYENALEFLDQEAEWYLSPATHTLFYKPRAGENPVTMEVVVPTVETLVSLSGTPSDYVHNVQFIGILFEHSNWSKPNTHGYLNGQAGVALQTDGGSPIPGMVQLDYARNIRIERNLFRHSGAHALTTVHNTTSNVFVGNTLTNLAGGGIYLSTASQPGASTFDTIKDNLIERVGQVYSDCVGIFLPSVANTIVEHNVVRICPYTGISIGWSWDDTDQNCRDNAIQFNLIHDVMQLHDDGGGIYSLGRMTNGMIAGNYIYGITPSSFQGGAPIVGIYLDNGSCYKTVQSNICDLVPEAFFASNPPNYSNTFQYNFHNGPLGNIAVLNTLVGNTAHAAPDWPGDVLSLLPLAGLEGGYRDIDPLATSANLRLQVISKSSNGIVTFDVVTSSNAIIALETSTDLVSWNSWATNLLRSGNLRITDTGTNVGRFYRGRQLQP